MTNGEKLQELQSSVSGHLKNYVSHLAQSNNNFLSHANISVEEKANKSSFYLKYISAIAEYNNLLLILKNENRDFQSVFSE